MLLGEWLMGIDTSVYCSTGTSRESQSASRIPLVTDLDDTLITTDSLYEGFLNTVRSHPLKLANIFAWLRQSRQIVKKGLMDTREHVATYPINEAVLNILREAATQGREIWLATASPLPVAQAVAERLGFFKDVLSSSDELNLKGSAKAQALVERFGKNGFDYIGDSAADIPIWAQARKAYVYGSSQLYDKVLAVNTEAIHIPRTAETKAALRELRIWQWVKNLLVFLPLFLAHDFSLSAFGNSAVAFIALSLCASAGYVINDMADLTNDRAHPVKCKRPLASGALSLKYGMLLILGCLCGVIGVGCYLGLSVGGLLACYFIGTLTYSFIFKKLLILDAIILAWLYDMRLVVGAAAIGAPISNWLLSFLLLFFFGLALMKRSGDLKMEGERMAGRAYLMPDKAVLEMMQTASGFSAITILCIYINSVSAQTLYSQPDWLWGSAPAILWWYCCLIIKAARGEVRGDPLLFSLKYPLTWIAGGIIALCFILAL